MPNADSILKDATPRPWIARTRSVEGNFCYEGGSAHATVGSESGLYLAKIQQRPEVAEANAHLITTAVNAYEHHLEVIQELVSACEAIVQMFNECEDFENFADDLVSEGVVTMLRNAIKLAKEQ